MQQFEFIKVCMGKTGFEVVVRYYDIHPRRPRGKIIGREEDKTAVSVGAKVYFSCVESTTKVNFRADRNRRFIFLAPDNLAPGSPRMYDILTIRSTFLPHCVVVLPVIFLSQPDPKASYGFLSFHC